MLPPEYWQPGHIVTFWTNGIKRNFHKLPVRERKTDTEEGREG